MDKYEIAKYRQREGGELQPLSIFHLYGGYAIEISDGKPLTNALHLEHPYRCRVEPGSSLWAVASTGEPCPKRKHGIPYLYEKVPATYTDREIVAMQMHDWTQDWPGIDDEHGKMLPGGWERL